MNKKLAECLGIVLLMSLVLLPFGCISKDKFADDPISWSYVSGDGSWDSNSRKWTVFLHAEETKSITIRLYNSSSQSITVYTVPVGPTDSITLSPQVRCHIIAGGSINITFIATADNFTVSRKYTIDYSNSFNVEP